MSYCLPFAAGKLSFQVRLGVANTVPVSCRSYSDKVRARHAVYFRNDTDSGLYADCSDVTAVRSGVYVAG